MGKFHTNLILNARTSQVEFTGGKVTELTANIISESIDALVDYFKDSKAMSLTDWKITVWGGCQSWDDSTSWEKSSELKDFHLVQTTEFDVSWGIDHKPAFNWLLKHVLKKRDRMIASIKSIELPKTVKHALALDAKNGNTLWADAKSKEMENVRVAFEVLLDRKSVPIGHHFV